MMHAVAPSQQQSLDNGVSKTPARSGARRALGDISNRKTSIVAPFNNNHDHNVSKTPLMKKLVTATNTSITKLPLPNHLPQPSLRLTNATTTTKRSNTVTFILPDDTSKSGKPVAQSHQHTSRNTVVTSLRHDHHSLSLWDYDDESEIEISAGRLYHQQLQLYDDYDGDNSESELSLEGASTFREDFVNLLLQEHSQELHEKENYMQHCIQALEQSCNITDDGTCPNRRKPNEYYYADWY